jgi:hypothetical protein
LGSEAPDGLIIIDTFCVTVVFAESVTERSTLYFPAVVGVPDIVPVELSVKPGGIGLLVSPAQVYGGTPPVAVRSKL